MVFLLPDISHHNCDVDADGDYIPFTVEQFRQASTVASAIMHKATQGDGFVSPVFETHARRCNEAGLPWAAYHFVDTVDAGDGIDQAEHFWRVANSVPGLSFVLIDWERAWRPLAMDLQNRLRELADVPVGDYIGSHARSQGGQLPNMDFHMVPQYGPAELDPRYKTDPLSAWQYTQGIDNGTDWPSGVPGIGKCDMSAVFRPEDFGFGGVVAISDQDVQKIVKGLRESVLRSTDGLKVEQAWRDANMTRQLVTTMAADVANWDDNVLAGLRQALSDELAELELGDLSVDEVAERVTQKFAERLSG